MSSSAVDRPKAHPDARPTFFNLLQIQLPVGALTSIVHRVTGVVLAVATPFAVYLLGLSLRGPDGYTETGVLFGRRIRRGAPWRPQPIAPARTRRIGRKPRGLPDADRASRFSPLNISPEVAMADNIARQGGRVRMRHLIRPPQRLTKSITTPSAPRCLYSTATASP